MEKPKIVLLFSGKRKSGKDYICEKLKERIGPENCQIIRISGPLKRLFAKDNNLNWEELMSDGQYKEKYRVDMINWSDEVRGRDPGYFCRASCQEALAKKIWIVSDIRRKTDIKWFYENYENIKTIRVTADLETRKARGWVFTNGVDDVTSECDLDNFNNWDLKLSNNSQEESDDSINHVLSMIKPYI